MINKEKKLVDIIVNKAMKVKKNDRVLITTHTMIPNSLVCNLIGEIYKNKGMVSVKTIDELVEEACLKGMDKNSISFLIKEKRNEIKHFDVFIDISCIIYGKKKSNSMDILNVINRKSEKINNIKINEKRWIILNYPSDTFAKMAKMTKKEFYDYSMNVMTLDYSLMEIISKPIENLMKKTNMVKIIAQDTELTFSIKDMNAVACFGQNNIPDGECFTAPVKKSVNGHITFNTPTPYMGKVLTNVKLTFKNGKIVDANCSEGKKNINNIINTDKGSKYIGEFAIGFNPLINEPIGNILFDEKINGSIHLAIGDAYKESDNKNRSAIHLDLVQIQRKDYGGGEIYFDDLLIMKDGKFIVKDLIPLNYKKSKK